MEEIEIEVEEREQPHSSHEPTQCGATDSQTSCGPGGRPPEPERDDGDPKPLSPLGD